jgi:hypothetical protein
MRQMSVESIPSAPAQQIAPTEFAQWDLSGLLQSVRRARRRPILFNVLAILGFGFIGLVTVAQNLAAGAFTLGTAVITAASAGIVSMIALFWLTYLPQGPTSCRIDDLGVRFEYTWRPEKLLSWSAIAASVSFLDYGPPRTQFIGKPYQPGPFGQRFAMKGGRPRYTPLPGEVLSAIFAAAKEHGLSVQTGRLPTTRGGIATYRLISGQSTDS